MTARPGLRNVATAVALITASAFVAGFAGVRVNTSSSLPLGLYSGPSRPSASLDRVLPVRTVRIAIARPGYRVRGFACPDRAVPLLKPVVARAGDVVKVSPCWDCG